MKTIALLSLLACVACGNSHDHPPHFNPPPATTTAGADYVPNCPEYVTVWPSGTLPDGGAAYTYQCVSAEQELADNAMKRAYVDGLRDAGVID